MYIRWSYVESSQAEDTIYVRFLPPITAPEPEHTW